MAATKGATAPTSALAKSNPIGSLLKKYSSQLREALPKHVTSENLLRISINAISRTPGLRDCTEMSLLACVVECSQLGLFPDPILGEIFMVPFKTAGVKRATIIVGYQGFRRLIYNDGAVFSVESYLIRPGDLFDITYGSDPKIVHKPAAKRDPKDGEDTWQGVYSLGRFANGHSTFEYLSREDVLARRAKSAAFQGGKKDSPWFTDPRSMWRKSSIRAIAGVLPKSREDKKIMRAVGLDSGLERGAMKPTPTGFEFADESERLLADGDPSNGGDLQEAREAINVSSQAADSTIQSGSTIDVQGGEVKTDAKEKPKSKAQIKRDIKSTEGAGAKPQAANKPTPDPVIARMSDIYNLGIANGWKIEEINAYLLRVHKVKPSEARESMRADIEKAMREGTSK
jgi:recombination protein RecT